MISLEPGITAIVGPNGSGKSNISDSVLWVLGERNAKNCVARPWKTSFCGLRPAKALASPKSNSCSTTPTARCLLIFNEVSLTRRMYRSGESEYLINGAPARRMDFMDILHDTGLWHRARISIISRKLDAILASKPEDLRTRLSKKLRAF